MRSLHAGFVAFQVAWLCLLAVVGCSPAPAKVAELPPLVVTDAPNDLGPLVTIKQRQPEPVEAPSPGVSEWAASWLAELPPIPEPAEVADAGPIDNQTGEISEPNVSNPPAERCDNPDCTCPDCHGGEDCPYCKTDEDSLDLIDGKWHVVVHVTHSCIHGQRWLGRSWDGRRWIQRRTDCPSYELLRKGYKVGVYDSLPEDAEFCPMFRIAGEGDQRHYGFRPASFFIERLGGEPPTASTPAEVGDVSPYVRVKTDPGGGTFFVGSGIVCGDHRVLTNAHVVRDGRSFSVDIAGEWHPARVLATDSRTDLALVAYDGPAVAPVSLAPSAPADGEEVTTHGFPRGGERLDRTTQVLAKTPEGGTPVGGWIPTRTNFVNGESGGGVLDAEGRIVGLISAGRNDYGVIVDHASLAAFLSRHLSTPVNAGGGPPANDSPRQTTTSGQPSVTYVRRLPPNGYARSCGAGGCR